jgi:phosphoserine phosphatase
MQGHTGKILNRFLERYSTRASSHPPIAVFDCDDTLIRGDIGESMLYFQLEHFLLRTSPARLWPDHPRIEALGNLYDSLVHLPVEKVIHDRRYVAFAEMVLDWYFGHLAEYRTVKACSDIVRLFADFSTTEVREIAHAALRKELEAPLGEWTFGRHTLPRGIRFIKETVDLLTTLQDAGFDIWVVSGSNQWSVEAVCSHLDIPPSQVFGIDLQDRDGTLLPLVREPVPVLEGKVDVLQMQMRHRPAIAVSDSTYDLPLFQHSSGLRVLIAQDAGANFFRQTGVAPDESWLVFEQQTLLQSIKRNG